MGTRTSGHLVAEGQLNEVSTIGHRTPLFSAAGCGNSMMTDFLLKQGADVDIPDEHGNSVLHVAAGESHATVVKVRKVN